MTEAERIAAGLTEAQRRALMNAQHCDERGVWHPSGWYAAADKRVRYNLSRLNLTVDYLRRANRLTPLGLEVRTHLTSTGGKDAEVPHE
ncbi:hypothetical protein [Novosphingobium sp.]|uniref:hypothetical protein n=1 Tax=Novosphingobium sp. TaxID=1874826 RepID=UPI00352BCC92